MRRAMRRRAGLGTADSGGGRARFRRRAGRGMRGRRMVADVIRRPLRAGRAGAGLVRGGCRAVEGRGVVLIKMRAEDGG